jgi:D-glycero-alpha-D-manno-heptose-7-phosphate kinase
MALNLRTRVSLTPFREGWVAISSEGFAIEEEHPIEHLPFEEPYGIFLAAMAYFSFHGLKVHIRSDSPVRSALGGSSTALIALLKALSKLAAIRNERTLSPPDILHLGYHLEDGVSGGHCGIQDQAAAVYGGVNLWTWCYGDRHRPFQRESLLDRKGQKSLSRHLLVAFSGKTHASGRINRSWVQRFLSGETRSGWLEVNRIVHRLGSAIRSEDWPHAAGLVREEMAVRREITPEALIPITQRLVDQAEMHGCGARFAGAGAGGSLWAIGATDKISRLRADWEKTLAPVRGAGVLDCEIDPRGVQ